MKKYNYQTSYEDAIKNGVSKEEYSRFSSKLWCLNNISNELAEANRLKIIELKMLSGNFKLNDFSELEDRA